MSLKGVVKVGAVDCAEHKALCKNKGVHSDPDIKLLVPGPTPDSPPSSTDYFGEKSAKAMAEWYVQLWLREGWAS